MLFRFHCCSLGFVVVAVFELRFSVLAQLKGNFIICPNAQSPQLPGAPSSPLRCEPARQLLNLRGILWCVCDPAGRTVDQEVEFLISTRERFNVD